jgi:Zn-dependent protease
MDTFFSLIILIFSVVVHEVSHGYMARYFGDMTAEREGRLTLNPLKHADPFGSVILPLLLVLSKAGFVIGWAKPVPYNPDNFGGKRYAEAAVAFAGPLSNIILALLFSGLLRALGPLGVVSPALGMIFATIVFTNLFLAAFNLIPIPPLDGSKILFWLLPQSAWKIRAILERYSLVILLVFIFFGWEVIVPCITIIFSWLIGIA